MSCDLGTAPYYILALSTYANIGQKNEIVKNKKTTN